MNLMRRKSKTSPKATKHSKFTITRRACCKKFSIVRHKIGECH